MAHFTSNTYQMKREILTFSNKISASLSKPERKFTADMVYGMLASGSCLLTNIVDRLHENSKKVNSVERLTGHLIKGTPCHALQNYLAQVRSWVPDQPVIHIDDSDVAKPSGYRFEAPGMVRDGSKSSDTKTVYGKGYHVTEACVHMKNNHPVSIFSEIHSSKEQHFTSINDINLCMAFLAHISMKAETNALKAAIIQTADPIKEKVSFCYYRLAKGICGILSYAKEGVRLWFKTKRPAYRQICLRLII